MATARIRVGQAAQHEPILVRLPLCARRGRDRPDLRLARLLAALPEADCNAGERLTGGAGGAGQPEQDPLWRSDAGGWRGRAGADVGLVAADGDPEGAVPVAHAVGIARGAVHAVDLRLSRQRSTLDLELGVA